MPKTEPITLNVLRVVRSPDAASGTIDKPDPRVAYIIGTPMSALRPGDKGPDGRTLRSRQIKNGRMYMQWLTDTQIEHTNNLRRPDYWIDPPAGTEPPKTRPTDGRPPRRQQLPLGYKSVSTGYLFGGYEKVPNNPGWWRGTWVLPSKYRAKRPTLIRRTTLPDWAPQQGDRIRLPSTHHDLYVVDVRSRGQRLYLTLDHASGADDAASDGTSADDD